MNIIVTGANGLIGRTLVAKLKNLGHSVVGIDLANDPQQDFTNPSYMARALSLVHPDTVIHLAALKDMNEAQENPELYNQVNVVGTKSLIDLCVSKGVNRFIFASSASVNDGDNAYANSKREIESYLDGLRDKITSAMIRFESIIDDSGQVYRPTAHGLIDNLIMACREGKEFVQNGNPIRGFMALSYATQLIVDALSLRSGSLIILPIKASYIDVTGFIRTFNSLLPNGSTLIKPKTGQQREWEVNTTRPTANVVALRGMIDAILKAPYIDPNKPTDKTLAENNTPVKTGRSKLLGVSVEDGGVADEQ